MASASQASAARSNEAWWQRTPIIEEHEGVLVVREDLVAGGSKIRFLPHIVGGAKEIVFGGPYCGGAPYALSVWGARMGVAITLFSAKRNELHWRQKAGFRLGSTLYQVPAGRMSVVQHRARTYAKEAGALFLPLGFDLKDATEPFEAVMRRVRAEVGQMDEVWCATGSGMLARCLGQAFPDATIKGVVVGLKSRNQAQAFPPNVELIECPYDFADPCRLRAPFPSCLNYDAKAWEALKAHSTAAPGRALFWNVLGDTPQDLEALP
jgi:hypothetical protein